MFHAFIITFLFLSSLSPHALAKEQLRFKEAQNKREYSALRVISQSSSQNKNSFKIAAIDLNNDFIDEYIVTPNSPQFCDKNRLCPYHIIAFAKDDALLIGRFDAHKILISDKKTYGIRNIIVYNDTYNDFQNKTARWNPFSFTYQTY